ncbi:hypothetical protein GCM10010182_79660 [Actinomadura cremea]|nr:hypothetical protein GCM10010182_79660 [Actinomadura cremea]
MFSGEGNPITSAASSMAHIIHTSEAHGIGAGVMRAAEGLARRVIGMGNGTDGFIRVTELLAETTDVGRCRPFEGTPKAHARGLTSRTGHSSTRVAQTYLHTRREREIASTLDKMAKRELPVHSHEQSDTTRTAPDGVGPGQGLVQRGWRVQDSNLGRQSRRICRAPHSSL